MRFPFRSRRREPVAAEPEDPPPRCAELALAALVVHAEQLDERLEHLEHHLDEVAMVSQLALEMPANGDLREARVQSDLLSAELAKVTEDLQDRIDQLAAQLPAVVTEDCRHHRACALAETILDLSDALDTTPVDLDADESYAVPI